MAAVELGAVVTDPNTSATGAPQAARALLPILHADLERVREEQHAQQQERGATSASQVAGHRTVMEALERYADALEACGLPIPRTISADLRLRRSLCGLSADGDLTSSAPRRGDRLR